MAESRVLCRCHVAVLLQLVTGARSFHETQFCCQFQFMSSRSRKSRKPIRKRPAMAEGREGPPRGDVCQDSDILAASSARG